MKRRGRRPHPDILTPREWEVLGLIREGLSNEQIAERLAISVDGAKYHVSEILSKLGARDRLEAARWSVERRPWWAIASGRFAFSSRIVPSWLSPVIAAGLGIATTAGIGLLVWALVATSAKGKSQDGSALFSPGGADPPSFVTFRLSGGDLPHAIIVSEVEYTLSTDGFSSAFDWYARTGMPEPLVSATRYQLEQVTVQGPSVIPSADQPAVYVPGAPSLITDNGEWAEPSAPLKGVLDRYIKLDRRGLLPEQPTFAESLDASRSVLATHATVGQQELKSTEADRLLSNLGASAAAIFGVRGKLIGQRDLGGVDVHISLGADELAFTYVRPGPIAPYGLLFHPKLIDNWEYVTMLDPPGYAQRSYSVSPRLDDLMAGLGFGGSKPKDILETRLVRRAERQQCCVLDRIEVWGAGEPRRVLRDLPSDVLQPGSSQTPVAPFSGKPQHVELWFKGVDPFPAAVKPGESMYYPRDASDSGKGVLVPIQPMAVYNGTSRTSDAPSYYASNALDALLRNASP